VASGKAGSFALTKWYIDCLDREGRLTILYWASLEWRRFRLTWHSVSICAPGEPVKTRSSVVACAPPVSSASSVTWNSARLKCEVELTRGVSGIAEQELAPGVSWTCVAPAARATIRLDDTVVRGTGYAEVIRLTTPPWKVGIRELRWGRWISDDATRSVVWIAWAGDADKRWAFLDGKAATSAALEERSISAGDATLALDAPTVLVDRGLAKTIGKVPGLRAAVPRWLSGGHEQRRTRAGILREGRAVFRGSAVDEVVSFG